MKITKIGKNITVFTYDTIESYITNVFLIEKDSRLYLVDTFCGSNSLSPILQYISKLPPKELIVINTHFHWDHVWGNCCFKDEVIIGHEKCRELLDANWEEQIHKNKKYIDGDVEKVLPNVLFKEKIIYPDDGIEIFYSPGHTIDSISIFDHQEEILITGDNLEKPIIYVESEDVDTYIETLRNYTKYKPKKILASHNIEIEESDLNNTIKYLEDLLDGKTIEFNTEYEKRIHRENFNLIHKSN